MSTTTRTVRPTIALALAVAVAFAALGAVSVDAAHASGAPFPDVPEGHPFCREIDSAQAEGFVTGYVDGTSCPVPERARRPPLLLGDP